MSDTVHEVVPMYAITKGFYGALCGNLNMHAIKLKKSFAKLQNENCIAELRGPLRFQVILSS